jgi:hypothetical protein
LRSLGLKKYHSFSPNKALAEKTKRNIGSETEVDEEERIV